MAGPRAKANKSGVPANSNSQQPANQALADILQYGLQLERNGRSPVTVKENMRKLRYLSALTTINEPEQVKEAIARHGTWSNNTKRTVAKTYASYLKFMKIQWERPHYTEQPVIPFIPMKTEIDQLIAAARCNLSALLQFLKETGARVGEATQIEWTNVDIERKTVYIKAEKGSNPRLLPISGRLLGMIQMQPKKNKHVFYQKTHAYRTVLSRVRANAAKTLSNPRLMQIHFHTLRHWEATMEYHKTKDIIHVRNFLGHKDIESTMIYINIEKATFLSDTDEWTCRTAATAQEAIRLIETGFQYVTTIEEIQLFKKRR